MSLCCSIHVAENKKHLVVVAAWGLFIYLPLRKNRTGFASRPENKSATKLFCLYIAMSYVYVTTGVYD